MEIVKNYLTENPCYKANVVLADGRYATFQYRGPVGLMLHSVGCSQSDAGVFIRNWNKSNFDSACVHAFVDSGSGIVYQTLPWNYRGWHAGGDANNTHVGVEMCESKWIRYTSGTKFEILDRTKALADCVRAYRTAVELFAKLCKDFGLDPMKSICSHNEGGKKSIASGHVDPEHYWSGLGISYTMDGFRRDVKRITDSGLAEGGIYRIQLGAFKNKQFAEMFLADVRKNYPDAFLVLDEN